MGIRSKSPFPKKKWGILFAFDKEPPEKIPVFFFETPQNWKTREMTKKKKFFKNPWSLKKNAPIWGAPPLFFRKKPMAPLQKKTPNRPIWMQKQVPVFVP